MQRNLMAARADHDALTPNAVGTMYEGATRTPWGPYANNRGMLADELMREMESWDPPHA